jgi:ABC-type oligopeptide transport system substrate-binding subunit
MRRLLISLVVMCLALSAWAKEMHPPFVRIPLNGMYPTLDPGMSPDTLATEVQLQMFVGLTQFDPADLKPLPYLAEEWNYSSDKTEYTFYLRKDARWTDGSPVTAHDVLWAVRRNISPETGSETAFFLYVLKNGEKIHKGEIKDPSEIGAHLIDDYTIRFTLEHPASYFPAMAACSAFWPLPGKTVARFGPEWTRPDHIVTNGPYQLKEIRDQGKTTILVKNQNFFDADTVNIPEIHYLVTDPSRALAMYEQDRVDIMGAEYMRLPPDEIPRIKEDIRLALEYKIYPRPCVYYFGFNARRKPSDNPLVRKAISAAIDREKIVSQVIRGGNAAYTFTPPPLLGTVDPAEGIGIRFNPEQARKWLKDAGYPDGKGFPPFVLIYNTADFHTQVIDAIREQLKTHLNIHIQVQEYPWDQYRELLSGDYPAHMFRMGWCADYPDANNALLEIFHPDMSANRIGWNDKIFAVTTENAQRFSDAYNRERLYKKAEQILCETEAVVAPIFYYTDPTLIKPWLDAKIWPILGNHIRTWSFKTPMMMLAP